jgi:HSP20 family protein
MVSLTRYSDVPPALFGLQRLNRMLDEAFAGWPFPQSEGGVLTSAWVPPCDISEDANSVTISMEVPGVRSEDVRLSLENNILTIRGEKKQETTDEGGKVHRFERSYGMFERTFSLPSTVDPEKIEARYEDGILNITIPKAERARPREIPVSTSGGGATQVKTTSSGGRGGK